MEPFEAFKYIILTLLNNLFDDSFEKVWVICIFIRRLVESCLLNDSIFSVAVKLKLDFFKKGGKK